MEPPPILRPGISSLCTSNIYCLMYSLALGWNIGRMQSCPSFEYVGIAQMYMLLYCARCGVGFPT